MGSKITFKVQTRERSLRLRAKAFIRKRRRWTKEWSQGNEEYRVRWWWADGQMVVGGSDRCSDGVTVAVALVVVSSGRSGDRGCGRRGRNDGGQQWWVVVVVGGW
ncbi:hypothetical protein E3N88_02113 [Mikania micrantha]|uniref:Uncharacterized protein n=1 Tax=Mikania micrantha TaxID=192012 RepID=A0A5N6Q4T2_9ASTR|nr:hypothetical protein E3N88_02113 [Mikania micrantha]